MTLPKPYYQDDWATIYHADCRDILPSLDPVDLVLTDPPYGINECRERVMSRGRNAQARDYGEFLWDSETISDDAILRVFDAAHRIILFGGNYYSHLCAPSACWLVWDKDNGTCHFADCELAWTNLPQAVRLGRHRWNGMLRKGQEQRWHPTQKPLDLMKWCITIADKHGTNATILDPFMGSGTTLHAAKDLNRRAIGIEISEEYCAIAAKRLRQEVFDFSTTAEQRT